MAQYYQNIGQIILMLLLLIGSAFFSGSETAFFNLSRRQVGLLRKSKHKIHNMVANLLNNPGNLLSCLLFGNMTVNVLFYASASVFTIRMEQQIGITAAVIIACLAFAILVLFGEILPKSLAFANSKAISIATALPVLLLVKVFTPLQFLFKFLVVEPTLRLLLGPAKQSKPITADEFKSLIEQIRRRGLITADENKLIGEIIELGFLKVRHVMRPRVDIIACKVTDSAESICQTMHKNHLTKVPVYVKSIDNIVGLIHFRRLLLHPDISPDKLVGLVNFVPEQKTVESLLEFFRKTRSDTAIVVDEYGGIAGSVCLEDIAEELLGPIEAAGGIEPIELLGPLKYRLAGDLSIHDWADTFGIVPAQSRLSTIAGLVTALLGKIPKTGDVARLKNLKFTVEKVRKHRIETIILTMEPISGNDN